MPLSSTVLMLPPTAPHIGQVIRSSLANPPAPISGGFNSSNSDSTLWRCAAVDSKVCSFSVIRSLNSWIWASLCKRVLFNSLNCEFNWVISPWAVVSLEFNSSTLLLASLSWFSKSEAFSNSEDKFDIFSLDSAIFVSFRVKLFSRSSDLDLYSANSVLRLLFSVFKSRITSWSSVLVFSRSVLVSVNWFSVCSSLVLVSSSSFRVSASLSFVWANSFLVSDSCFSRSLTLDLRSNRTLPSTDNFLSGLLSAFAQSILIIPHLNKYF